MSISDKVREQKREHDRKRALLPQFPRQRIDKESASKIDDLVKIFGTKKAVLLAAIDLLHESEKKRGK